MRFSIGVPVRNSTRSDPAAIRLTACDRLAVGFFT